MHPTSTSRRWTRPAVALAALAASLGSAPAPATAEEPLDRLVVFAPDVGTTRQEPVGIVDFYVQEAGIRESDVVQEYSALPGRSWHDSDTGLLVMRGTRFTSADLAEEAGARMAAGANGPVRDLGSLGDGFIVSIRMDEDVTGGPSYVHDGFRVRGRDVFSFVAITPDPHPPLGLTRLMAWHAETFAGGSTAPVPARSGGSLAYRIGQLTGVLVLAILASAVVTRLLRPRRKASPAARSSGPTAPGGQPTGPGSDGPGGQARVVW